MSKKNTRDYFHILYQTEQGAVTRSAHTREYADRLLSKLREEHGDCPGRLALQTWSVSDETGPVKMLSEEIIEAFSGWEAAKPIEKKPTPRPIRSRFSAMAEWPTRKAKA